MVIQVDSYLLFGTVQSVLYIMLANDEIISYANKLCNMLSNWSNAVIQTRRFNYILPVVVS